MSEKIRMDSQDQPPTDAEQSAPGGTGAGAVAEGFPGTRLIQIGLMTAGLAGAGLLFNSGSQAAPSQVNKPSETGRASQSNAKVQVRPIRLVSLAPSNTELLAALGATDHLVGVCTYCDYPQQISSITRVGTFVSANLERLARLKPDAVLLVSGQEHLDAILKHNNFKTLVLKNNHLNDIGLNIKELARLVGKEGKGEALAKNLEDSMNSFHNIIGSAKSKPRVFYCIWPKPLMTVGKSSFLDGVITACGGINIASGLEAAYPSYNAEKLLLAQPDVIIMPYEARTQEFLKQSPWKNLKAVKDGQVYFQPEPRCDMLARPTLRILDGLAWLGEKLHPELASNLSAWHKTSQQLTKTAYTVTPLTTQASLR